MLVLTTKGMIEDDRLVVSDKIEMHPDARVTVTMWHLDGELVRQDVNANVLRGHALSGDKGEF